jgi:hypothetical protein
LHEWLDANQGVKAFYFASTELKIKHEKEEASKINKSGKRGRKR